MCALSFMISVKFANVIIKPLNKLLSEKKKKKKGDYSVRVPERESKDEIFLLEKEKHVSMYEVFYEK